MDDAAVRAPNITDDTTVNPSDDQTDDLAPRESLADPASSAADAEQTVLDDLLSDEFSGAPVIEALLFSSDVPLSAARLTELVGAGTPAHIRKAIEQLNEKYAAAGLTFRIEALAGGYQMLTLPDFKPYLSKLDKHRSQSRLTDAALETLAIVAYKQPIIRADVEAIRGVASGEVLNRLRDMRLIKTVGRAEVIGRPLLYGTTRKFLEIFGLSSLSELPPLEALTLRRPPAEPEAETPAARAVAGA